MLFKKGYLSRPKPYAATAQQDAAGNGMEDVLVLTPEEAIAAGLMHGYDPENPYIGFYDATGMFYVNRKCLETDCSGVKTKKDSNQHYAQPT